MNTLDIVILLLFIPGIVRGLSKGFLEQAILYTQLGRLEEARELLLSKRFNIYEGGEGKLTRHHGWLYTLLGRAAEKAGKPVAFCGMEQPFEVKFRD